MTDTKAAPFPVSPSRRRPSFVTKKSTSAVKTPWVRSLLSGYEITRNPLTNKGLAFTMKEREQLRLRGIIPPAYQTQDVQLQRVMWNLANIKENLQKYLYLMGLQDRNEKLFYRAICENIYDLMPIVYTPVVGLACQEFGHIYRRPRGLFISLNDLGHVEDCLRNWPQPEVRAIVVTDGERILGLGDLGADGMGIPVGKLSLYSACGGVDPQVCLPITLDTGTNNKALLDDPMYIGLHQERERGPKYDQLVEEFVYAVQRVYGQYTLIQWEDFGNQNAFRILEKFKDKACCFNDDIQGTASVTVAGIYAASNMSGHAIKDHKFVFLGAGEAGAGIAELIAYAVHNDYGIPVDEARKKIWLVDSQGLVCKSRKNLAHHKLPFAHEHKEIKLFEDIVRDLKPTALIGVSAQPRTFTEPIVKMMAEFNKNPIIFALSNPTSLSECTASECYEWTEGRGIFASGSPFGTVEYKGKSYLPGQGNNAFIFPGVGLAVVSTGAVRVNNRMFLIAAKALAKQVTKKDEEVGSCYPPLRNIREVSIKIAAEVAKDIYDSGLGSVLPRPDNLEELVRANVFSTDYDDYTV